MSDKLSKQEVLIALENAFEGIEGISLYHKDVLNEAIARLSASSGERDGVYGEEYWFADCDDSDYSGLFNNSGDASIAVNDHGGHVIRLRQYSPPVTNDQAIAGERHDR